MQTALDMRSSISAAFSPSAELASSGLLLTNAKVSILGDEHDVQALKNLANKKFEEIVPNKWKSSSFLASL